MVTSNPDLTLKGISFDVESWDNRMIRNLKNRLFVALATGPKKSVAVVARELGVQRARSINRLWPRRRNRPNPLSGVGI